mmetsp:Transcript_18383/g.44770  ORF Transcript_18383/g.44770 Transcript_18383/m.44770 type:complete len:97 (+) Transcript_18383:208-498(+)|eukprot:CAMPEP_0171998090 /NCGR_PEP_ID=MMETSP1041-20130122/1043_1 /TAXON_ID=464988 /ORGANISM="Hemiselmis andersenii, Strain CCMP439" /LENGTH=96 /DNA_ID=CAMNT_0012651425 /DNA_START=232 /DNA_END=522 /DNA_ORIENTATION=-
MAVQARGAEWTLAVSMPKMLAMYVFQTVMIRGQDFVLALLRVWYIRAGDDNARFLAAKGARSFDLLVQLTHSSPFANASEAENVVAQVEQTKLLAL